MMPSPKIFGCGNGVGESYGCDFWSERPPVAPEAATDNAMIKSPMSFNEAVLFTTLLLSLLATQRHDRVYPCRAPPRHVAGEQHRRHQNQRDKPERGRVVRANPEQKSGHELRQQK